jgi:hypothetical protein
LGINGARAILAIKFIKQREVNSKMAPRKGRNGGDSVACEAVTADMMSSPCALPPSRENGQDQRTYTDPDADAG